MNYNDKSRTPSELASDPQVLATALKKGVVPEPEVRPGEERPGLRPGEERPGLLPPRFPFVLRSRPPSSTFVPFPLFPSL